MKSDVQDQIENVVFQPGDILFHENEQSFHFFILQSGKVEIFKRDAKDNKILLAILSEGAAIGEFAMISRTTRSATARALTVVHAARVSEKGYEKLLNDLPDWALSVMKALIDRIHQTNEIVKKSANLNDSVRQEIDSIEFDPDTASGVGTTTSPFLAFPQGPHSDD